MPHRTLIVGGGLTGAALARLLQETKLAAGCASEVVLWDRNSILGGRVMARSFPKQRGVHVDVGAQYWTPKSDCNDDFRQRLTQDGRLVPFPENAIAQDPYKGTVKSHLVSPDGKGFRAMVEHLLGGTETKLSTHLESFQVLDDKRIQVTTNEGKEEIVNELVLTCPIPNVLSILKKSSSFHVAPEIVRALEGVTYSQRFAAAYVFNEKAVPAVQELGWTAKYVPGDKSDIIRFVCWDHLKKQAGDKSPPALIVHTSVAFGSTFMDDTRHNDEILALITKSLREVLPSLPAEQDARLHRWRISQVTVPYHDPSSAEGDDPLPALVLSASPRVIVAGDSFLGSGFDNCLVSAKAAADLLRASGYGSPRAERYVGAAAAAPSSSRETDAGLPLGYLRKKSRHDRWQRRYFEATTHYLTYYKNRESEKLLACIDLWRTQTIDFYPADGDKLEFSIAIGEQSYLLKADSQDDAERWVQGLQARQYRPEGTPSEVFSLRSEHMDAESDASSSEYGGRRPRGASSDSGSRRSSLSLSYVETQNPVVPNAAAIARMSLSHADAPNPVVPSANLIARASFSHAEASNPVVPSASASAGAAASTGPKYPLLTTNQQVTRSVVAPTAATKTADEEAAGNAQCCAPCLLLANATAQPWGAPTVRLLRLQPSCTAPQSLLTDLLRALPPLASSSAAISTEDERKKRSINEMFGDEDSDDSGDEQIPRTTATTTTADASGLFGSDSESDEEKEKPAKRPASPPAKRVKKARDDDKRRDEGDEYDSGEEAAVTKEDDDFIDRDDDLADVLGEYDDERQQFDDERPLDEPQPTQEQKDDFFDRTLQSLKTGRSRAKLNLSPQEMEQITQEVLYRMDKAYADDLASIAERRPALEKIKFVGNALHVLRKIQFQPMLLDFDLLTIVKKWIQPLEDGTLPNVGLRTKMLEMVSKMPVFKEHLKRSGLGKVVMLLMKHPQETPENKELCRSLVERWSRAVFNKTLDFSKLAELEAEKADNEVYRRRERARRQKKSKDKSRPTDRGGNVFNARSADPNAKLDVSERAELPEQLHIDFLLRPQSKIDMNAVQAKKADPDSRKARLAKRMQEIARPGRKTKRATGVSIEGR
ncbi:hypothetical protein PHYPSEUDO_011347 [Phytophthora pseudosyringae]|uniref:TFIIS N-terminal domain-containing protein n=1 Tax=Phytophthora pseudosyringae TaxID=221518 RepID=A0A8T1W8N1_9STRA|nr:hypothetical protein PHYPSEUDO_011347 [Phytophthora pseudosyringae]